MLSEIVPDYRRSLRRGRSAFYICEDSGRGRRKGEAVNLEPKGTSFQTLFFSEFKVFDCIGSLLGLTGAEPEENKAIVLLLCERKDRFWKGQWIPATSRMCRSPRGRRRDTTATPLSRFRSSNRMPPQISPLFWFFFLLLSFHLRLGCFNQSFFFFCVWNCRIFRICPHPDEKQRMQLSRDLGLEPRQIKFWFQNRRTQLKARNLFLRLVFLGEES